MAQNITLLGANYSAVPSVLLPKTGGGSASFVDITDTTAAAADVASGKYFYAADGTRTLGTASGGGGSSFVLLASSELSVNTTSTSAASAGTVSLGSSAYTKDKIIWVNIRDKNGKRAGYFYGSDAFFINYYKADGLTTTLSVPAVVLYRYTTSSSLAATAGQYGVYGYSINSSGTLTIRRRYNSSYSLTINSTYVIKVYAVTPPIALF